VWWLGLLGLVLVTWGVVSTRQILYPERRTLVPPALFPAYTTHTLRARDGSVFDVWRFEATPPRARLLVLHGYFNNRYQVLGIAQGLQERGYEVLLFELRGHGSRPGPYTLGIREAEDAAVVLQWAGSREPIRSVPSGILGWSSGAAVACQLARRAPQVRAVVTDSLYPRFYPIVRRGIRRRYHLPTFPWAWITWGCLHLVFRRRLARLDPVALGPYLNVPLFAIQGGQDHVVPPVAHEALYASWAGPKERWVDPSAGHVGIFARDPQQYCNRVAAFFDHALKSSA